MLRGRWCAALAVLALIAGCAEEDSGAGPTPQPLPTGSASGSIEIDLTNSTGAGATGTVTIVVGDEYLVVPVDVALGVDRTVTVDYSFPVVTVGRTGVFYVAELTVGTVTYNVAGYTTVSVTEGDTTVVDGGAFVSVEVDPSFSPVGNVVFTNIQASATTVADPIVTLTGTIANSDIAQVFIYVNGDVFPVGLDLTGGTDDFTAVVTLDPGVNEIIVAGINTNGVLVVSSPIYVTYTSTIAGNAILGTLIWDSPTSDIDLHLWYYTETSPTASSTFSQHCYYANEDLTGIRPDAGPDGIGNLDYDDTEGYGPEHMTLIGYPDGYYSFALYRYSMDTDLASNCIFTLKVGASEQTTSYQFTPSSNYWYRCYDVRVQNGTATILAPNVSLPIGLGKALLPAKNGK